MCMLRRINDRMKEKYHYHRHHTTREDQVRKMYKLTFKQFAEKALTSENYEAHILMLDTV